MDAFFSADADKNTSSCISIGFETALDFSAWRESVEPHFARRGTQPSEKLHRKILWQIDDMDLT